MCVTICGRFCPDEGAVAGYGNRIRAKYTAKWDVQIAGMIFQTHSNYIHKKKLVSKALFTLTSSSTFNLYFFFFRTLVASGCIISSAAP